MFLQSQSIALQNAGLPADLALKSATYLQSLQQFCTDMRLRPQLAAQIVAKQRRQRWVHRTAKGLVCCLTGTFGLYLGSDGQFLQEAVMIGVSISAGVKTVATFTEQWLSWDTALTATQQSELWSLSRRNLDIRLIPANRSAVLADLLYARERIRQLHIVLGAKRV